MREKDKQRHGEFKLSELKEKPLRTYKSVKSTPWSNPCEIRVASIEPAKEFEDGKYCQFICATDAEGVLLEMNYKFDDLISAVDLNLTGKQLYKIKYYPATDSLRCVPLRANPPETEYAPVGEDKWDKINLGKCRHGILCAYIQYEGLPVNSEIDTSGGKVKENITLDRVTLKVIDLLAHFSMTGEIE